MIKMTAENPEKQIGVNGRKGSITIGKDADLLLNESWNIKQYVVVGQIDTLAPIQPPLLFFSFR